MSSVTLRALADVESDPDLPTLAAALDPVAAQAALRDRRSWLAGATAPPRVRAVRVAAYKPRRRCLVEYELEVARHDGSIETVAVLGKIRANRFGNSGYRQLRALWNAGFSASSGDRISVPEPLGTIPTLRMWVQKKIDGRVATDLLPGPGGVSLAEKIADAVQKLHSAGVAPERRHTMADELRILERCLRDVATAERGLASRVSRLVDACGRAGEMLPEPAWCGSHRDFYADQVLVAGERLFLIDFDLYCEADPGLDVGNFIGHVSEQSLRVHGAADALAPVERALEDRFVSLAGEHVRLAVRVYAGLTIARHVYLSTRLPNRGRLTAALLALAETRLQQVAAEGGHA